MKTNNSVVIQSPAHNPLEMSTEDLRRELAAQITVTAKSLQRMGEIWCELERRGEDLSDLRAGGLYAYLPMIASNKLRAELVVRFAGKSMLLKALAALPLQQQDQLLESGKLPVALPERPETVSEIPLADMRAEHIRIVFSPAGIRPPQEQRRMLKAIGALSASRKHSQPQYAESAYVFIDPAGVLKSGKKIVTDKNGTKITADDMVTALSAYYNMPLQKVIEDRQGK